MWKSTYALPRNSTPVPTNDLRSCSDLKMSILTIGNHNTNHQHCLRDCGIAMPAYALAAFPAQFGFQFTPSTQERRPLGARLQVRW